jgi:hypothetical protein
VTHGPDGKPEIHLFPLETGSGGNYGLVDIGGRNSSTPMLKRQIVSGITEADLAYHGGQLALDGEGELRLSADPGLKAGAIEDELVAIIGQPRIIPLYREVLDSGNGAEYVIVGFAGVRIVEVELTTSLKSLKVQAATIVTRGGIPADPGQDTSSQIFSPVSLTH